LLVGAREEIAGQFPGVAVEVARWTEESESDLIARMDIGIMPLRDGPWERGKCGYKIIQYMACGLPVVASPVGVNTTIVQQDENGYLANNASEWLGGLERLILDTSLRARMGEAGYARVKSEYSLAAQAPRLASILRSVGRC
jgi:glycosyltransferase involved in cell wall biosynthesis